MKIRSHKRTPFAEASNYSRWISTLCILGVSVTSPYLCAQSAEAKKNPMSAVQTRISVADTQEVIDINGMYQVRIDGSDTSRPRKADTRIHLRRAAPFDPLLISPLSRPGKGIGIQAEEEFSDTTVRAHIIQFHSQALPDYQSALKEAGVDIVSVLPPNAVIGLMSSRTKVSIDSMTFVRAVVDYLPGYKLQNGLENEIDSDSGEPQTYSIMSVSKKYRPALVRFTKSIGGKVLESDPLQTLSSDLSSDSASSSRFSAILTAGQLEKVSRRPETLFVDVRGEESEDLDHVREREGFNYIESVAGYCGEGVGIEVYDRGFRLSHQELTNKPILVRSPNASGSGGLNHGTEIAGLLYAEGVDMSKGLLHCASRPIVFSRFSGFSNNQPTESQLRGHLAELVDPDGPYRAVLQTSSTDYSQTQEYTTWSAEYDEVLFELDFVKLQSQSNEGNRDSRPAAWAKNVVSVGGFSTNNTVDRSDDRWRRASIGPAADNRIKPDLSGQYGGIRTIDDKSNTAYGNFGGTSGATPTVAGAFGIMFEMWADGVFDGGPGKRRDVFDTRPHAATAKALMVHSAYRYDFSGGDSANMSRVHQGWGAPDLQNLYDTAESNGWSLPILINEDDVVAPGRVNQYRLTMDGNQTLKATMVYRDPRGNPAAAVHRINDLSLRVTSPSGTVYWGNNGLRNGNTSTPGGNSNTIDTVENVFIPTAEAGTWTIEVLGDDIMQDGHVDTPDIDAVYALIATGGTAEATPSPAPQPTAVPTPIPTPEPTAVPTPVPTPEPTAVPTPIPTPEPTAVPTPIPTPEPTAEPTPIPTPEPTAVPTPIPTPEPTAEPTPIPTPEPTAEPTPIPTPEPTAVPSPIPTPEPTAVPTPIPTPEPTAVPTPIPTPEPTPGPVNVACRYEVANEWSTGFIGSITITNNSSRAIDGWTVNWKYSDGTTVISAWNTTLANSGGNYSGTNFGYNGNIAPNGSVTFGFQGAKGQTDTPARVPVVSGDVCSQVN